MSIRSGGGENVFSRVEVEKWRETGGEISFEDERNIRFEELIFDSRFSATINML